MEELKEIKIGDNEIVLNNNLVKTNILPQSSKELARNIKVQANVVAEAAVFGSVINIEGGNVTFEGPVYANNELHVANEISENIVFKKVVASADNISAFLTTARAIFGSDINAVTIKLKNCFVGGSIFGSDVFIENCVVLGGVFATKNAVISNSIVGTFNSPTVELAGVNYLLYPAGFSVEPLTYLPQTELYNLSIANLGALFKGEKEAEYTGKIKMNLESDKQRAVLVGEDDNSVVVNSYSVSGRVLAADIIDFEKLENHFLIGAGALNSQILKVYSLQKEDGTKSKDLTLENVAEFFFDIISGKVVVQDVSGELKFEDIKKSFE